MQLKRTASLTILSSLALANAASAGIVFSDDFDGPTTFWRARQNYDSMGVHPPDVGVDPWGGVGVLRDGSDAGYPAPSATGGTFYAEPLSPRLYAGLTSGDGNATENQLVRFSWEFYVQGYTPAPGSFSGLEICGWDTAFLGQRGTDLVLQADGTLKYYTNSEGIVQVPANQFSFPTNQWMTAQLLVDYLIGSATLSVGTSSYSFNVADSQSNRVDTVHIQNHSTGGKLSWLDNFVVSVPSASVWAVSTGGDWTVGSNWSGGTAPNGIGDAATLGGAINAPRTVYADVAITLGTLTFEGSNKYNLSGTEGLTMQALTGAAQVEVLSGNHKINLPLTFAGDSNVSVSPGCTLTLGDPVVIKAGKTVTRLSTGSLLIQAPLTIESGGTLAIGAAPLSVFGAPALASGARVNVGTQSITIDHRGQPSPAAAVEAQLTSGYSSGAWTGEGLMTSAGDAQHGLGWVADAGNQSIKVKYTYNGDSNLSGTVDSTDFNAFLAGYGISSGGTWANGDFNYDDKVNTLDFNQLAGNFGATPIPGGSLGAVVPEPASLSMLIAGLLLTSRRRNRIGAN